MWMWRAKAACFFPSFALKTEAYANYGSEHLIGQLHPKAGAFDWNGIHYLGIFDRHAGCIFGMKMGRRRRRKKVAFFGGKLFAIGGKEEEAEAGCQSAGNGSQRQ